MNFLVVIALIGVLAMAGSSQGRRRLTADHLAEQCYQKWYHVSQGSLTDDQEQCLRLKIVSKCWSRKAVDSSAFVDQARFFTEQEAIFSNILGICEPQIDVSALTSLVELSGMKNEHSSIIVDNDKPAQCATDAYNDCLAQYDKLYPNGKVCRDAAIFIQCMQDKATTCKAEIFQHFVQIFNIGLADEFTKANAKMHDLCVRE